MLWALQVSVSVIFFANKVFVLVGKKVGWALGAFAALLALVYFFLINLKVFTVLEAGLIVLMLYGLIMGGQKSPRVEWWIRGTTTIAMLVMAGFSATGKLTLAELLASAGMLWGTYFLASCAKRTGWALYVAAHTFSAMVGYGHDQHFFGDFQVASAIVALVGVVVSKDGE